MAFIGGFIRRWIADDGLIVLRTVANLHAGNGPVFNAGERVEVNTSAMWTFLVWLFTIPDQEHMETLAIWLGLFLGVAGIIVASYGASVFHESAALIPFGAVVYLALPPARDFLTSGLEWSLVIFYLSVLWLFLVRFPDKPIWIAIWAGLSWLVRPELALYGGLAGLALLIQHRKELRSCLKIVGAGVAIPGVYEIFRMGYYGLLTPHTAVAKSASESYFGRGIDYLGDFVLPYYLWIPLALVVLTLCVTVWKREERLSVPVLVMVGAAALHTLYVVRIGGDFMHARMFLPPLFALLCPVMLVPARNIVSGIASLAAAIWAFIVVAGGSQNYLSWAEQHVDPDKGAVYEPEVWSSGTGRSLDELPRTVDYYDALPNMNKFDRAMHALDEGDAFGWVLEDRGRAEWRTLKRDDETYPPTIYWLSLGYTGMSAPLEIRVLDPIGLSNPLAARQPRLPEKRIGHDKELPIDWQIAFSSASLENLPPEASAENIRRIRNVIANDPAIQELLASYRDPLTPARFLKNIRFALTGGRTIEVNPDPNAYKH
nr:hypothetical protein [Corynebacterium aquatimens]